MTKLEMLRVFIPLLCFGITFVFIYIMQLMLSKKVKLKTLNKAVDTLNGYNGYQVPQNIFTKTLIGYKSAQTPIFTDDNAKHIFVCGTTGSGKTVALANYIKSAINKDYPLLLVDGKGDINDGSILDIVNTLKGNKTLYVINMTDPMSSSKYNPFKDANSTVCKDMLINMTEWSEEHYKANTERYIERLVKLLTLSGMKLSFRNIVNHMPPDQMELLSSKLAKDEMISKEDHLSNLELIKTSGSIASSASARFSNIYESEIGSIFDDNGIDIHTALKEKAIILFILNPLSYPELSPLIGRLILIDTKKAVSKIFTGKIAERLFFIFDEINVYASPTLIDLINKSRSANVTCIVATQSLADLEYAYGDAFKEQLIENCNNYIIMRQNSAKSSEEWAKIIGTKRAMEVTYQIEQSNQYSAGTGLGSAKLVREFIYHPDDIKSLRTGEAIYLSKDENFNAKIKVYKPF